MLLKVGRAPHRWGPGKILVGHGDLSYNEPILV